jgi:hypothetical protein
VIQSPRQDLLLPWFENNGVLKLGHIAALDIAQWRIRIHKAYFTEISQPEKVLALAIALQEPATES